MYNKQCSLMLDYFKTNCTNFWQWLLALEVWAVLNIIPNYKELTIFNTAVPIIIKDLL